jgi:hypothetical protein
VKVDENWEMASRDGLGDEDVEGDILAVDRLVGRSVNVKGGEFGV